MSTTPSPSRNGDELPEEIYISLVSSLYSDPRTLIIGALGTIGAAAMTAIKTGDAIFVGCTLALALVH